MRRPSLSFSVPFVDLLLAFLCIFLVIMIPFLLLPHEEKKTEAEGIVMGSLCVEISWPNERNIDIDLWGHSPKADYVVGWTNMHSPHLNLYRDVVGFKGNPVHQNLEVMCSQDVPVGEWVFNIHYFSNHEIGLETLTNTDDRLAVPVTMIVRLKTVGSQKDKIFQGTYTLNTQGQEKTMFSFVVNEHGTIIDDSINSRDQKIVDNTSKTRPNSADNSGHAEGQNQ